MLGIQHTLELSNGLVVNNAFSRVEEISGTPQWLTFTLKSYVSREMADSQREPLIQEVFGFAPDLNEGQPNFFQQAYNQLKTMEAYQDAVEITE
ncbi:hypothetical protein CCZ20_24420 [Priestia aryabhattai]|uniref:hypothetical protein n=1 Tax=Priestia aryabhattai TaxID=412384 RepID=UPI000B504376|nr:hypothetical protein [Priestia aryabhattai]OVE34799.1 hypothetical protein CCZ20_24420 [Priestia aryabhattai]